MEQSLKRTLLVYVKNCVSIFQTAFLLLKPIVFRGGNSETYLRPPEPDKLFLISPPVSPPVGWEQKVEDPPVVDLNLLAAIAQLRPSKSTTVDDFRATQSFPDR
jgi:hypothetical protein